MPSGPEPLDKKAHASRPKSQALKFKSLDIKLWKAKA